MYVCIYVFIYCQHIAEKNLNNCRCYIYTETSLVQTTDGLNLPTSLENKK